VVIGVPERKIGEPYAVVAAAVRDLTEIYGLRVVVDGSPNSLHPGLLATKREIVIDAESMSKEQIESIPEFKGFIDFLKSHNLDESVWKVLGGSPADYMKLKVVIADNQWFLSDTSYDMVVNQVKNYLQSVLSDSLNKNIANSSTNTQAIIEVFRNKKVNKIPMLELAAIGLLLDYPNKVFRKVNISHDCFVEPYSPAVSLIISENVKNNDGVYELLEKLLKKQN
jgi:hypothetical protein